MNKENENAEGGEGTSVPSISDEFKNFKAETARKMDNVTNQLKETQAALLAQIQTLKAPTQSQPTKRPAVFEDEEAYATSILRDADSLVEQKLQQREAAQAKQQAVLNDLYSSFPELGQTDSALTKRAVEIFQNMPADEKGHPLAFRTAVSSAALDLGVVPKNKRKAASSDDFSVGGGNGDKGTSTGKRKGEVSQATSLLAEAFGINLKDPKVAERIKNNHGRESYEKFSPVKE